MPFKDLATARKFIGERRAYMRAWLEWFKRSLRCQNCGESDWRCLDFHHRDPADKRRAISRISDFGSMKQLWKEIEKCDVLCANCHRKKTIPI